MTEDEVNIRCKEWLISRGYKYKGILNKGLGQVPVPDGTRQVLIDHCGVKDRPVDLVWVEAKGGNCNLSELLEGFVRLNYAVFEGGGCGYLAIPHKQFNLLLERKEFLEAVAHSTNGKGSIGLLDLEENNEIIL
jgi:hypothetical protein